MAALPPTAELLARSFGVERLSSLLGAAMLVHQVGGFFGAWLGGVAVEHSGSYTPLWIADIALAGDRMHRCSQLRRSCAHGRSACGAAPQRSALAARSACAAAPGRRSG